MGRSSSITNSFVNGVIPCIEPSEDEVKKALEVLGMATEIKCAYCGGKCTEWDHLNPLISEKQPTGFITEIHNLVPSCSTCNSSKGNKDWVEWLTNTNTEYVNNIRKKDGFKKRLEKLKEYERLFTPLKIDFNKIDGWKEYIETREKIINSMRDSQEISRDIKSKLKNYAKTLRDKPVSYVTHSMDFQQFNISTLVDKELRNILENRPFSDDEIVGLLSLEKSKELFNLYFPLLTIERNDENKDRYYKDPIVVKGKRY